MLTVCKKIEKRMNNLMGIVQENVSFDYDKPFLFCIGVDNSSNIDLLNNSLVVSRIFNGSDKNAKFSLDSFPANFLSFSFENDEEYKDSAIEIVDKFIYPFLINKGKDIESIKKQARKMNFISFSSGLVTYENIEDRLKVLLKKDGLSDNDISNLLSQVSLVSIGGKITNKKLDTNTIYFVDVNDKVCTCGNPSFKNLLNRNGSNSICGSLQNNILLIFEGNGNNTLDNYVTNGDYSLGSMAIATTYYLNNSICANEPISSNGVFNALAEYKYENSKSDIVLSNIDSKISYKNAPKLSDNEIALRNELDIAYSKILELGNEAMKKQKEADKTEHLLSEVKYRTTDTTYYQILASLGLISNADQSIMSRRSDREIIDGIQDLLSAPKNEKNDDSKKYYKKW